VRRFLAGAAKQSKPAAVSASRSQQETGPHATASLQELAEAGTAFCALPWDEVKQRFIVEQHVPQEYVMRVCFSAAYMWTLLHDAFHLADSEQRIIFSNSVQVTSHNLLQCHNQAIVRVAAVFSPCLYENPGPCLNLNKNPGFERALHKTKPEMHLLLKHTLVPTAVLLLLPGTRLGTSTTCHRIVAQAQ
jgi:hypothetical protein